MTSAPSTCCTRPPGPRPNAATPCSRPPSRRCAESASAPGASAPSPPPPSSCSTVSTTAAHDQQASGAVTGNGSVAPPCRAFDTGLRPGPFPDRAASLLPGLLAATRTGLAPASDDEHEHEDHPSHHEVTSGSAGRTKNPG